MKQRHLLLLLIAIVYFGGFFALGRWTFTLQHGDSSFYYMHVVSLFVNQDVGNYDKTIDSLLELNPNSGDPRKDKFGIRFTEKGRRYIKYTLGVPVMETPFFLIAHAYAKLSDKYAANGWSLPYMLIVGLSIIFYVLIGFNFLIKSLERYFSKTIVALSVLAIALATNIFFQSVYVTMSHGFLFFDYCLLIYLTLRFYDKPTAARALGIGAMVGLIALTRVPEVISALIPLLWGVVSWKAFKERLAFFGQHYRYLLLAAAGFFAVFSIQFTYWYYVSGYLVFNPYGGEGFNFLDPHIWNGWFHFANGWLIYTPIMALSLIGWFFLRKYAPDPQIATFAFVGLQAYIHYSYYVWNYFPGLGSRPMVETYPILTFSMAAFFVFCWKRVWLAWFPIVAIIFFTALNMFQTWQMNEGIIWSERHNKAFYFEIFGRTQPTLNSLRAYDIAEMQPDSSEVIFIKNLAQESFEDSTFQSRSAEISHSGSHSVFITDNHYAIADDIPLREVQPKDWLRVSIYGYFKASQQIWARDLTADLFIELMDKKKEHQKARHLKIASHIGNEEYSIWSTGKADRWGEASFFTEVPKGFEPSWTAKAYIINNNNQRIYLDDFRLDLYRCQ